MIQLFGLKQMFICTSACHVKMPCVVLWVSNRFRKVPLKLCVRYTGKAHLFHTEPFTFVFMFFMFLEHNSAESVDILQRFSNECVKTKTKV